MYNVNGMCKTKAFTLIELLITISIIAVLSGIGFTTFTGVQMTSRDGKRKAVLESIRSALEIYRSDNGAYPTTTGLLVSSYIASLPKDPKDPVRLYGYTPTCSPTCTSYVLCAALERGTAGDVTGCNLCGVECNYKTTNP